MKKALSWLMMLVLALAIVPGAFAAQAGGALSDGNNDVELPWDAQEAVTYTYTATQTGTLYIAAVEFNSAYKDRDYADNSRYMYEWAMYTDFTVDGEALEGHYYGTIEVVKGKSYTFSWAHAYQAGFGWSAVLNLSYTDENVPKRGTEELPAMLYAKDCPTQSMQIPAGGEVHYTLYEMEGAVLTITGADAYAVISTINIDTMQYEDTQYDAVDGVVTVPVQSSLFKMRIGNNGSETQSFALDYYFPLGTRYNPKPLVMGENVAITEFDNYDGYCFSWTAECDGVLTLTFSEAGGWQYRVSNKTLGKYGDSHWCTEDPVPNPAVVQVSAGDVLHIFVNSYDSVKMNIPGGEVKMTASVVYTHVCADATIVEKAESCLDVGVMKGVCDLCGEAFTQNYYGDHEPDLHEEAKEATCSDSGMLEYWHCATCDGYFTDEAMCQSVAWEDLTVAATGRHSDADGQWETDGESHWHTCACGKILDTTAHRGGKATCTQKAACSVCGAEYGEVDGESHGVTQIQDAVEATCANNGYSGDSYCTDCGQKISSGSVIPATGNHADADGKWETDGESHWYTCACGLILDSEAHCGGAAGCVSKAVCDICGAEYGEVDGESHGVTQIQDAVEATCANSGYSGDTYCTDCGQKISSGSVIPATGNHADADGKWETDGERHWYTCACGTVFEQSGHSYGPWEILKEATQEDGLMRRSCVCGHYQEAAIPAQHVHSYETTVVAPSCYADGYTTYYCSCGYSYTADEVPGGHILQSSGSYQAPGCVADGMRDYWYCGACQTYFEDEAMTAATTWEALVITAQGHMYELTVTQPSCTEDGYTTCVCTVCGQQEVRDQVPAGHRVDKNEAQTEATCEEAGRKAYWHCSVCGAYFADEALSREVTWEELTLAAPGHTQGEWTVVKEAGVGVEGLRELACVVCGQVLQQEQIPALEEPPVQTTAPAADTEPTGTTLPAQVTVPTTAAGDEEPRQSGAMTVIIAIIAMAGVTAVVATVLIRKKHH